MNYFELFGIPVQLQVNPALLSKKFFELSRQHHPDYVANENSQVQSEALERSALLNKAWKTFQDPGATIKYVLLEKGLLEEEEKYELPPGFLMEVLEINEQLMDSDATDIGNLQSIISNLQSAIYAPVKAIVENYKEGITTKEELLQVKEYYFKKKYLDRITKELSKK
jgi:molecular chaperone HscB